jgi:hypothetical protein
MASDSYEDITPDWSKLGAPEAQDPQMSVGAPAHIEVPETFAEYVARQLPDVPGLHGGFRKMQEQARSGYEQLSAMLDQNARENPENPQGHEDYATRTGRLQAEGLVRRSLLAPLIGDQISSEAPPRIQQAEQQQARDASSLVGPKAGPYLKFAQEMAPGLLLPGAPEVGTGEAIANALPQSAKALKALTRVGAAAGHGALTGAMYSSLSGQDPVEGAKVPAILGAAVGAAIHGPSVFRAGEVPKTFGEYQESLHAGMPSASGEAPEPTTQPGIALKDMFLQEPPPVDAPGACNPWRQ